jgi:hypothetical protein
VQVDADGSAADPAGAAAGPELVFCTPMHHGDDALPKLLVTYCHRSGRHCVWAYSLEPGLRPLVAAAAAAAPFLDLAAGGSLAAAVEPTADLRFWRVWESPAPAPRCSRVFVVRTPGSPAPLTLLGIVRPVRPPCKHARGTVTSTPGSQRRARARCTRTR